MSRRTQAQWRDLISQQQSSGVSAAQFCRERSINPNYFSARKKQLRDSANSFVRVAPPVLPSATGAPVKLRIIELEVSGETLLDSLSLLLERRER